MNWHPATNRSTGKPIASIDGEPVRWETKDAPAGINGPFVWRSGPKGLGYYPAPGMGYSAFCCVDNSPGGNVFRQGLATFQEASDACSAAWAQAEAGFVRAWENR